MSCVGHLRHLWSRKSAFCTMKMPGAGASCGATCWCKSISRIVQCTQKDSMQLFVGTRAAGSQVVLQLDCPLNQGNGGPWRGTPPESTPAPPGTPRGSAGVPLRAATPEPMTPERPRSRGNGAWAPAARAYARPVPTWPGQAGQGTPRDNGALRMEDIGAPVRFSLTSS
jgi:hypothetical protein